MIQLSAEMFVQILVCLLMPLMLRQRDKDSTARNQSFKEVFGLLRKDTIYISSLHWEPKVPSATTIQKQVAGKHFNCHDSVRLNLGKLFAKKDDK